MTITGVEKIVYEEVTIADGATVSDSVDVSRGIVVGIVTDASFTSGNLSFQNSDSATGTFNTVIDASSATVTVDSLVASRDVVFSYAGIEGMHHMKVVNSSTQSGDTVIKIKIRQRQY